MNTTRIGTELKIRCLIIFRPYSIRMSYHLHLNDIQKYSYIRSILR